MFKHDVPKSSHEGYCGDEKYLAHKRGSITTHGTSYNEYK